MLIKHLFKIAFEASSGLRFAENQELLLSYEVKLF